jgi:regulator of sirC expression with transglutaminase-like and TPR domain
MGLSTTVSLQQILSQSRADGLAEAALWVSHEVGAGVDVDQYLQRLQFYAEKISDRLPSQVRLGDALFQLNDYLFNDRGFISVCSNRCQPEQIFLDKVIDTRRGSPLSIALIYLTVGRLLGLPLEAASFPGRILIRYSDAEGDVVIDPGDGGMPLQDEDLALMLSGSHGLPLRLHTRLERFLSNTDDKTLLVRMLRQLKRSYLLRGDPQSALWVLEKILLLTPEVASGFRERGYLYELLDCSSAAVEDYRRYLELLPDASDAEVLRERLPGLIQSSVTVH